MKNITSLILVSIPFKREGISELGLLKERVVIGVFQFPSNGKVFPNGRLPYE